MAMSKEEQKAASGRIMAKHPLTDEERQTCEMLVKKPEDYRAPDETGKRVCGVCGAEFRDQVDGKGNIEVPALEKFSDHQATHNSTAAQWSEAHKRIQAGKERQKTAI